MTCNCDGRCLPLLVVKCTSCRHAEEVRGRQVGNVKVGERVIMGVTYRCPNPACNRRNTSVGTVKQVGEKGCSKIV